MAVKKDYKETEPPQEIEPADKELPLYKNPQARTQDYKSQHNKTVLSTLDKEYTKDTILNLMQLMTYKPVDPTDTEEVRDRISDYFEFCSKHEMRPTVASLALMLGVTDSTFMSWVNNGYNGNCELRDICRRANQMIEAIWEDGMYNGKINSAVGIFIGKNRFGMKETSEINVNSGNALDDVNDPEEIAKRYAEENNSDIIDNNIDDE